MAMSAWSATAASNVLANTGINCDEGMAPSAVNDSIREIMAVLKTQISSGAGSVGTPAYCLATDTDTGLYIIGANNIGFACAGAKVLDIATTGLAVTGALSATTTVALVSGQKLYLDGVAATGNTYLIETSADVLDLFAGAAKTLSLSATGAAVTGTLSATGLISKSNVAATDTVFFSSNSTTTGANAYQFLNTGGTYQFGVENSAGTYVGATAYDAFAWMPSGKSYTVGVAGTGTITRTTSTGLAVTGALSATTSVALVSGQKLYLDGVAATGNTYLIETSADVLDLFAGAAKTLSLSATGAAVTGTLSATTTITSTGPTSGIGYATGAGGTVSQGVSKAEAFTLSTVSGQITFYGVGAGGQLTAGQTAYSTWTNTAVAATDVIVINHVSGGTIGAYRFTTQCAAGSVTLGIKNDTAGTLTEAVVISFVVIKGVTA